MPWSARRVRYTRPRRRARYQRYVLQVAALVAFAGTAALAVVLTRAPEHATLSADGLACTASGLAARVGIPVGGGAIPRLPSTPGRPSTYTLEFTNISDHTCVLDGYPAVDAYDGGRQIGSPAAMDTSIRPHTVTLAPGGTAHATLRFTGTGQFGADACRQVTASSLRVYPPARMGGAMLVPWRVPACSRPGPHFLSIAAIQPRSGLPKPGKYIG